MSEFFPFRSLFPREWGFFQVGQGWDLSPSPRRGFSRISCGCGSPFSRCFPDVFPLFSRFFPVFSRCFSPPSRSEAFGAVVSVVKRENSRGFCGFKRTHPEVIPTPSSLGNPGAAPRSQIPVFLGIPMCLESGFSCPK